MASSQHQETVSNKKYEDYESGFDARTYLDFHYDPVQLKNPNGVMTKVTNDILDIFNNDILSNPSGTTLDFGCGPSILGAMCASRRVPNIICADPIDGCRQEISKWLNNNSDAFDWLPYVEYISNKEGIRPNELEMRIRSAIKHVIPCDARADTPLGDSPLLAPYDVIMSYLVIQAVCHDNDDVIKTIRNLCNYLKPKGVFIMSAILNSDCYSFGDPPKTFYDLRHTKNDVIEFLEEAGMKVVSQHVFHIDDNIEGAHITDDTGGVKQHYIVTSKKV